MNGAHRVRTEEDISYELHITLLLNNFSCYKIHLINFVKYTNSKISIFII
jgi:hypothetical protein